MAVELNPEQKIIAYRNLYGKFYRANDNNNFFSYIINKFLNFKLRIKIYSINIVRKFKRLIYEKNCFYDEKITINTSLSKSYNQIKNDIEKKGYIFLTNFINQEYYDKLLDSFPEIHELNKSKSPLKNYDMGYIYLKDRHNPSFKNKNYFSNFYDYIRSKKFQKEVSMIFDNQYNFFCKNILTSIATKSSFLIPHKDSLSKERKDINLNFIYFIDGYDKNIEYSGGTFISKDNNGNKILLSPLTLKNSVLIYDNTRDFFHGFRILKENCYRKAITFQFNQ